MELENNFGFFLELGGLQTRLVEGSLIQHFSSFIHLICKLHSMNETHSELDCSMYWLIGLTI